MAAAWALLLCGGCGGQGGAWLWWLTDPSEKIKAQYELGQGRLVILIDDDKGWLKDPTIRQHLSKELMEQLWEHEVNRRVVGQEELASLRQRDKEFERRGAREIGQKLEADLVLHLRVHSFTLRDETVDPAYKGLFEVAVKVLDVHANKPEDVRLWPRLSEGHMVTVTTDLHTATGSAYQDKLTRRLCREMADKIAKLFYDHTAPKPLGG